MKIKHVKSIREHVKQKPVSVHESCLYDNYYKSMIHNTSYK